MQTRLGSLTEAVANVLIGYLVAVTAQALAFPLFGITASTGQHFGIAAVFTGISLVRSYGVRRLFNAAQSRKLRRELGASVNTPDFGTVIFNGQRQRW